MAKKEAAKTVETKTVNTGFVDNVEALEAKMKEMREAQKSLLDAEERILSAAYNTKMCEISLLQISGNITRYLE